MSAELSEEGSTVALVALGSPPDTIKSPWDSQEKKDHESADTPKEPPSSNLMTDRSSTILPSYTPPPAVQQNDEEGARPSPATVITPCVISAPSTVLPSYFPPPPPLPPPPPPLPPLPPLPSRPSSCVTRPRSSTVLPSYPPSAPIQLNDEKVARPSTATSMAPSVISASSTVLPSYSPPSPPPPMPPLPPLPPQLGREAILQRQVEMLLTENARLTGQLIPPPAYGGSPENML
ncbi:hypothetical protein V5O48_015356 [Marasmius crinis-equi]|uniref:Uncharacterized protein n=1 Tax=Marasmius crinis-equi TaxID=585013 RepID=A0ABR3EUR4_9AGAR